MDAIRLGQSLRALRLRRGLRQIDVADRADVSRGTISNLERGLVGGVSMRALEGVAAALGAGIEVRLRWRGADLDRLLDEGHARLVDAIARGLRSSGWDVALEVTFSIYGERGAIDLLAFHPPSRQLLVIEAKTVVPDIQSMLSTLDRKARLAGGIAASRGWVNDGVSRLLVIEDGSTSRDRIHRVGASLDSTFPMRGAPLRSWLRSPSRPVFGLLFFRSANRGDVAGRTTGRQRVRCGNSSRRASHTCTSGLRPGAGEPVRA